MKMLISSLILLSGLTLATGACSPTNDPVGTEEPTPVPDPEPNPDPSPNPHPTNGRVLVVYFSCTNTTKGVAEHVASVTGSGMYRIEPKEPYTSADLDYNNSSSRANREQNDSSARPVIANSLESLSDYDVIFIGYPIWWGKAPKIIFTFLESYDFVGRPSFRFAHRTPAVSVRATPTCIRWLRRPHGCKDGVLAVMRAKATCVNGLKV